MRAAAFWELFENSPQGMVLMSPDNLVLRVNREFTKAFGFEPSEIVGQRLGEHIVPAELRDQFRGYWEAAVRGETVNTETVRKRKDGRLLDLFLILESGKIPGGDRVIYAIFQSIRERASAAPPLQELKLSSM